MGKVIFLPELRDGTWIPPFSESMRSNIFAAFKAAVPISDIAAHLGTPESVVRMLILKQLGRKRGSRLGNPFRTD